MPVDTVFRNAIKKKQISKIPDTRWRSTLQEKIYGRRLLEALRATKKDSSQPSKVVPSRVIKEAADSALALTAKGQTRWSRAILSRRWRKRKLFVKVGSKIRRYACRRRHGYGHGHGHGRIGTAKKGGNLRCRLRVLSRLVPGCRKISTPDLLEETVDYVAALEVQVKAMRTLVERLASVAALAVAPPVVER